MPLQYNNLSTLTSQQQRIADSLESRVGGAGKPMDFSPEATASYINKSVATPLLNTYDQEILPRLKDSFASIGALAGSRSGVMAARQLGNLQDTIASELAKAQLQNQQLAGQQALQYNQLGAGLVGQEHMAIQPYTQQMPDQYQGDGFGFGQSYQPFGALSKSNKKASPLSYGQGLGEGVGGFSQSEPRGFSDYLDSLLSGEEWGQEDQQDPEYGDYPQAMPFRSLV